jgi:putative endonuclease
MLRHYHVYVLANASRELYVGVTGNLVRRVHQHRSNGAEYTTRHAITCLVYCESTEDILAAIEREKQIKGWTRRRKLELIERLNPDWKDLAEDW